MAKYSTGGTSGGSDGRCELCGGQGDLETATVAGATLEVCSGCAEHGDGGQGPAGGDDRDPERRKRAAQNAAKLNDAGTIDGSYWEDGAEYDDDQLPYLVPGYGDLVTEARQEAGLQTQDLAADLEVAESDLLAVEQGRATKAGVGGSLIEALEGRLDVDLVSER